MGDYHRISATAIKSLPLRKYCDGGGYGSANVWTVVPGFQIHNCRTAEGDGTENARDFFTVDAVLGRSGKVCGSTFRSSWDGIKVTELFRPQMPQLPRIQLLFQRQIWRLSLHRQGTR